jgi:hypothetical protein
MDKLPTKLVTNLTFGACNVNYVDNLGEVNVLSEIGDVDILGEVRKVGKRLIKDNSDIKWQYFLRLGVVNSSNLAEIFQTKNNNLVFSELKKKSAYTKKGYTHNHEREYCGDRNNENININSSGNSNSNNEYMNCEYVFCEYNLCEYNSCTYSNICTGDLYIQKSDDYIRTNYIRKLIENKVMRPGQTKYQTITIYDWDDTLLCTSFLGDIGFVDISKDIYFIFEKIDENVVLLLEKSLEYGDTYIITNSADGWVLYSSKKFLPKTYELITSGKISIISARTLYESCFPGDPNRWKVESFIGLSKKYLANVNTNLVCLGDSHIEIDAAHILGTEFENPLIKTIKLKSFSGVEELFKQQQLIIDKFDHIYSHIKNMTIRLEKK